MCVLLLVQLHSFLSIHTMNDASCLCDYELENSDLFFKHIVVVVLKQNLIP